MLILPGAISTECRKVNIGWNAVYVMYQRSDCGKTMLKIPADS